MARSQLRLVDIPDRLTVDEFWDLFGSVEHETLDFKGGPNDSFKELLPAMAMTEGGLAVLGVSDTDDEREITGCPLSQRVQNSITRYANQCNVPVELKAFGVAEFELIAVGIPRISDRIVTTPDGRLLRRVGGDSQPLTGDALAAFVRDRPRRSAEEEPLGHRFDSVDFDLELVNSALDRDGRPAVAETDLSSAFVDLHLAERAPGPEPSSTVEVTTAAAILFARDPRRFVPGAAVQLVRRTGIGPTAGATSDRHECWGPLQTAFTCCVEFIDRHTRTYETVSGLFREPIPEYPHAVVREALLNALAHRDYGLIGTTIDVTVWDDRIEIRSPGPLPGHITVDNMRREHFSRNRRLMRALRGVGLVEEFGEGVDRMYHEMEARLMPPPEFAAAADSVTVTLRNQFLVDFEEQAWLLALEGWPGSAEERRVLVELRRRGEAAKRHLAEVLPNVDLDYLLDRMRSHGLVERVGRAGGTQYRLSVDVLRRAGAPAEAEARLHSGGLLRELERVGSLSTAEAARLLGIERAAARNMLNELVAAGRVRPVGNTRARRYFMISDDADTGTANSTQGPNA
ncbi:ATP-binding protein [Candidatus Poriferisodalis sp.]|uniref:ATP-binding protein n=1 Tax=Candidatus Poriferisodalis sp. TaxID=3101277 RepID=UPI003B018288